MNWAANRKEITVMTKSACIKVPSIHVFISRTHSYILLFPISFVSKLCKKMTCVAMTDGCYLVESIEICTQ